MVEKKSDTVTLIAPNGQTVSVAESKKDLRIAAGYRLPEKVVSPKTGSTASK